jgi:hypothetical protein
MAEEILDEGLAAAKLAEVVRYGASRQEGAA